MSGMTTASEPPPSSEDETEVHIVFEYVIQRVPTRTQRNVATQRDDFNVSITLKRKNLDERGYPDPHALWFAERTFLKAYNEKHLPNVRLLRWRAHLKGRCIYS
jgi:hypothetical protein